MHFLVLGHLDGSFSIVSRRIWTFIARYIIVTAEAESSLYQGSGRKRSTEGRGFSLSWESSPELLRMIM